MDVDRSRVGVVGGSIAGCAAAIALGRLGCEVTILERSSDALKDRGSGMLIPNVLRDELIDAGYLPADYHHWRSGGRTWIVDDGSTTGRVAWQQTGPLTTNNWSNLWRGLREHVPDALYRDRVQVEKVVQDDNGVDLLFDDGGTEHFDIVVGADGYRSVVRGALQSDTEPSYAGYILWRGNFPASELADTAAWNSVLSSAFWMTYCFDGGHAVMYPIPDFEGDGLRVNWAVYTPQPEALVLAGPSSIPPGAVTPEVFANWVALRNSFPKQLQPLFAGERNAVSIQPVYDDEVDHYVHGRLLLIGDAATLARPHTGSGATKAMQEARVLERLGAEHSTWEELLAAYDVERTQAGRAMVALGRRIGRDQVEHTPPWSEMSEDDFVAWTKGTLSGEQLYFWGETA